MRIKELTNTLGIDRESLPQIDFNKIDDILAKFDSDNIEVKTGTVPVKNLIPTQDKIRLDKVKSIIDSNKHIDDRRLFISQDGHIIDGHHYWAANKAADPDRRLNVYLVKCDTMDLIDWFNSTDYVENKKITEGKKQ